MKSYEEVAKSVFEKSEKYFEEKARRAKHIKTAASVLSCVCLAAVIAVGAGLALHNNLTEYPENSGAVTTTPQPDKTDAATSLPDKADAVEPEPFIPGAGYYKLPDGSIYTAPDDGDLFLLGFAMVRENAKTPDDETKWQKLSMGDEWNGLRVEFAQSGWEHAGTSYSTASTYAHHQMIHFTGEKTFTGKAELMYDASGEFLTGSVFFLDEDSGGEMPFFPTYYWEKEDGYQPVFFSLYHEDYMDKFEEVTDLLLEDNEVMITITTDDFLWECSYYGRSIDSMTAGRFNTILSYEIN